MDENWVAGGKYFKRVERVLWFLSTFTALYVVQFDAMWGLMCGMIALMIYVDIRRY